MPIFPNVLPGSLSWCGEQSIWFRSSFDGSWFDASRAVPHLLSDDRDKQGRKRVIIVAITHFTLTLRHPELKGVLEADLTR